MGSMLAVNTPMRLRELTDPHPVLPDSRGWSWIDRDGVVHKNLAMSDDDARTNLQLGWIWVSVQPSGELTVVRRPSASAEAIHALRGIMRRHPGIVDEHAEYPIR